MIAAIVIADSEEGKEETKCSSGPGLANWSSVDVLGRPVIERMVDGLKQSGIDSVFIFADRNGSVGTSNLATATAPPKQWKGVAHRLAKCREEKVDTILLVNCGNYAEFDPTDMSAFHRAQGESVTRAFAVDGPLDLWMIDPSRFGEPEDLRGALMAASPAYYELRGYVNRLRSPRDLRRLVLDSFSSRCRLRPRAVESRPGVWIGENVEIGRSARIVPPVFLGRGVKIAEECLVTRGTNIERNSQLDFGTATEDSSILANTYLGIGLDLTHSIVDGRKLWNLRHDVTLEITDPAVMRPNPRNGDDRRSWIELQKGELSLSA